MSASSQIAVVGAGVMGLPVLRHLTGAGISCAFVEPDESRAAAAAGLGAVRELGPDRLGKASVLLLFVPTDDDVRSVVEAFLPASTPGAVVVICSSVLPATCQAVAALAEPRGVQVVDAALTGGVRAAEAGTLNLLVGGRDEDVAAVRELLGRFSAQVHHLGPLGAGQVGKAVNNLLHWAEVVALAEALSLGAANGIPPSRMRAALATGPTDSRSLHDLEQMRFTWFEKDIDNAAALAGTVGRDLPLSRHVQSLMRSIDVPGMAALLSEGTPIDLRPDA